MNVGLRVGQALPARLGHWQLINRAEASKVNWRSRCAFHRTHARALGAGMSSPGIKHVLFPGRVIVQMSQDNVRENTRHVGSRSGAWGSTPIRGAGEESISRGRQA